MICHPCLPEVAFTGIASISGRGDARTDLARFAAEADVHPEGVDA
jgi:hypothetical protein